MLCIIAAGGSGSRGGEVLITGGTGKEGADAGGVLLEGGSATGIGSGGEVVLQGGVSTTGVGGSVRWHSDAQGWNRHFN